MHSNSNASTVKDKFNGIGDSDIALKSEKKDRVSHRKACHTSKSKKGFSLLYLLIQILDTCCFNSGATFRRVKRSDNVTWKASQPLEFGKTARLSCCTSDKNLLGKTWKFTGGPDNTVLALGNTWTSNISKYGIQRQKNGFALLIYNLTKSDIDHLYTCSFGYYNSRSKTLVTNDDNTLSPPNVTISQSSYDVYIGSSVTLSSNVTSDLVFYDVYWMKKTGHDNEYTEVVINSKYSGGDYNTSSLTILITDKNDTGAYTCIARNEYGTGTSSDITLTVIEPHVFGNTKVGLAVGVTFACVALPAIILLVIWIYRSGKCSNLRRQNVRIRNSANNKEVKSLVTAHRLTPYYDPSTRPTNSPPEHENDEDELDPDEIGQQDNNDRQQQNRRQQNGDNNDRQQKNRGQQNGDNDRQQQNRDQRNGDNNNQNQPQNPPVGNIKPSCQDCKRGNCTPFKEENIDRLMASNRGYDNIENIGNG